MKKNIVAIILVFTLLMSFAACRKIEKAPNFEIESQAYIVDAEGETRKIYQNNGEYFYYDADGNRQPANPNDVVIETTKVPKTEAPTLTPEAQSFFDSFGNVESMEDFEDMIEADVTQPELNIDEVIPEDAFNEIDVEMGSDGKPEHENSSVDYEEVLKKETFTIDITMKTKTNGVEMVMPIVFMRNNKDLFIETAIPKEDGKGSVRVNMIFLDGTCYMVIPSMRAYMSIPKETLGEMIPEDAFDIIDEEITGNYVSSGEVVYEGEKYICDVYENEGTTVKRYYQDGMLKREESVNGENITIIEYNEVTTNVDKSKFAAPKNYLDLTTMMGNNFDPNSLVNG
ncbi:MAG: hypothetical protein IJE74_04965 [Clostridia bacterium]|nr:hypothetical protein [Clostridia bacterium]